ncbi:MAG: TolC family protein, partial [Gallionella sp.]
RAAEPVAPLTLKAALELALGDSPELSVAGRELEALEAAIIQAQARPNPEIAAAIEDTRRATRVTTLQLSQPIELGGKRAARIGAAERNRDAASAELDAKRAEIRAAVVAAFFDVLVAQERLRLARASVELAQRATAAASRRVTAGKVSPVEETRARVAEAGVRVELTLAGSELATARKRLAGTWGNPAPRFERADGDLETLPPLPALADLNGRLAVSPHLLRAGIEVERRQALAEIERGQSVPDMTVSLGARRNEELGLNQAILGISIPVPAFNRNQGNVLEALRRTDKARDELSAAGIRLSNELAQAHERLNTAHQEIGVLRRDILPGAQSAYDAATKGFELGKFSFLEVLDAQRTSFQAKSQYLRALAEAHRSAAEIERILGAALPRSTIAPVTTNCHGKSPPQIIKQRFAMTASLSPCSLPEGERDAGSLREFYVKP